MHISHTNKPRIFVTMGDPSGIGPEVIMKSMASPEIEGLAVFVIIGDTDVLKQAAGGRYADRIVSFRAGSAEEMIFKEDGINVLDPGGPPGVSEPGKPTIEGAAKALKSLEVAVDLMKTSKEGSKREALVTAPVSKEMIARVKPGFIGHTEYLQEAFSAERVTMVLTGKTLCVVPVTRHIPVKDIASKLTRELIIKTLEQVIEGREFLCGKKDVKIGVSALNPHCGEGGKIGHEEIDIIAPAVNDIKRVYSNIDGPISADVIFNKALKKEVDIVVSMYHDQCLSPFKMIDFDCGVNVTLGLEYIRTSPDHGTAFDIAGKGIASCESMKQAIKLAARAIVSR